jgi:hypothetical protein
MSLQFFGASFPQQSPYASKPMHSICTTGMPGETMVAPQHHLSSYQDSSDAGIINHLQNMPCYH